MTYVYKKWLTDKSECVDFHNKTQKCQQWPEYPAVRQSEAQEQKRQGKSFINTLVHWTESYLSLSTLLKPGSMCLKLELRSSLGWLLVRFIEPFSRRLRKPWQREGVTACFWGKMPIIELNLAAVPVCVCILKGLINEYGSSYQKKRDAEQIIQDKGRHYSL